ncbi:MAG: ATP-binding cassette domain-containing protein [Deltaproteobacteria bacterium]|nr:ATP-binding cassette domain-containing protein [Deltaproteobacteria bacterium]MBW2384902.1 ATP-binding cassette domain-containing protein [Deltaproteobacteria bacterium]MBW2697516.1 ATP-binding cassette domain-containing protein [Deltaproteobacteria bacterium]
MIRAEAEVAHVELCDVDLAFGRRVVFEGLTCRFPRGRISVIMGGSGLGKSTILRMIGGLQPPDRGRVLVSGQDTVGLGESAMAQVRRKLGMLFQNGALLDSMTVFENVALPLREHTRLCADEIAHQVHDRLQAVGLPDVDDLLPGELSGGMLRRAAFARAIVMAPEILLCDEPFSGLDPPNVSRIEVLLQHLNRALGLTLIVTSHHMATSLRMAEQLLLLQDRSVVSGAPAELAASRESAIAEFIGEDGAEFLARHLESSPQGSKP